MQSQFMLYASLTWEFTPKWSKVNAQKGKNMYWVLYLLWFKNALHQKKLNKRKQKEPKKKPRLLKTLLNVIQPSHVHERGKGKY